MSAENGRQQELEDCEDIKANFAMEEPADRPDKTKGKKAASAIGNDDYDEEAVDYEAYTKKDCPPRFSTLFESKPTPAPVVQHVEPPRPRRRSGIHLTWPAFILLALILFFETIALFTYTAIGLYNNMPRTFMTPSHASTAAFNMAPPSEQAPINISPNFVIGSGDHVTVTETVTVYATSTIPPSSSTSDAAAAGIAALASDIRGFLQTPTSSHTIPVVTYTPGGGTLTSVVLVTQSAESVASAPRSTSFLTVFVEPSVLAAQQAASSTAEASKSDSSITSSTAASSSTSVESSTAPVTSSSSESQSTTSSPEAAKGTNKACFGGAGAVMLNC